MGGEYAASDFKYSSFLFGQIERAEGFYWLACHQVQKHTHLCLIIPSGEPRSIAGVVEVLRPFTPFRDFAKIEVLSRALMVKPANVAVPLSLAVLAMHLPGVPRMHLPVVDGSTPFSGSHF